MKKTILRLILLSSTLFYFNPGYSNVPNTDDPSTYLGPTLKGSYTRPLFNDHAFSILGEAGIKNFRVGGTYGWQFLENQRIKFSAEYLRQKITYAFFSGNTNQWVDQGAVGAGYQWDIAYNDYSPQFDLSAYYAYAPSKNLGTVNGVFSNGSNIPQSFTDQRHIAGANAAGAEPGFTVKPWSSSKVSLGLNYDHVHYRKNFAPSENANGLGGTIRLNQGLYEGLDLNLAAAIRQPFNNYYAQLAWSPAYYNNWKVGIDGSYTVGKETLPNTYNAGIDINYIFDCPPAHSAKSLKGEVPAFASSENKSRFVSWVGDPAVYMPQVLAIADGKTSFCNGDVSLLSPIPEQLIPGINPFDFTIPTASHFSSNNLTFSMSQSSIVIVGNDPTITINPRTGDIRIVSNGSPTNGASTINVTATNGCSSATMTVEVIYQTD